MNLLSVNLARSIWLGPISDLNPMGINLPSVLFPFLVDTYKFRKAPSFADILDSSKAWEFQDGVFNIEDEFSIKINVTIHNDGLVVDTFSSTIHSDAFLEDMLAKVSGFLKMPPYKSILKTKIYVSQLFVNTHADLQLLNPKLSSVCELLSTKHENRVFQIGGLSFWTDQTEKFTPISFSFERALGFPFSENRYYSSAPLQTNQHIELLDKIEEVLS